MTLPPAVGVLPPRICRGIITIFSKDILGQQRNVCRTIPLYSHPWWCCCGLVVGVTARYNFFCASRQLL